MGSVWDSYPSLERALNARFRGQGGHDGQEWDSSDYFEAAVDIPAQAGRARMSRRKLNYRGIAGKRGLTGLAAANVDQAFLEEIGSLAWLRRLELEWPFLGTNLEPLLSLERLEFLSIDSPRNLSEFSTLLQLPALRTLLITNATKMPGLDWLQDAHHLEVIGVEGAIDRPCKIESLGPLAGLKSLRAYLGVSMRLADTSLMPLAQCPKLEYLGIARCAPRSEFDRLREAMPELVCSWFDQKAWEKPGLRASG